MAPSVAVPASPTGDRGTGPVPPSPETNPRLPGPRATRPGDPWRPALSPPAAEQSGGGASPPPAPPPGASTARTAFDGRPVLRWPLGGQVSVSRAFERPASPFGPGHRGIDLQALPGTPIRAAGDGTVSYAGPVAGRGVVVVSHGAVRTTYEPLVPTVRVGDTVRAGDQLGRLAPGHPGCPGAACLHWGLLRAADYLDPLASFRRVSPRLLPVSRR
ncbi:murein hydrolase activator EnvC family protein [Frankia sp. AgKG'84/4]|uniref:murein hydrolase activator EnvC family protein n=1 Tax=Frankia sp. AgKG'84/4 TaxID=573490 RepID=UPI0035B28315